MLKAVKPLLVLDINGTLLDRLGRNSGKMHDIRNEYTVKGKKLFLRPHLTSFIIHIHTIFDIACWTSAKQENGQGIVNRLFETPELTHIKLKFAWYREDCEILGAGKAEVSVKHLSKIWAKYDEYTPSNTLILDDSPHKSAENRNNALLLPTYSVCDRSFDPFTDNCLFSVLKYLKEAALFLSTSSPPPSIQDFLESNPLCTEIIADASTNPKLLSVMLAKQNEVSFEILPQWLVSEEEVEEWSQGRPAYRTPDESIHSDLSSSASWRYVPKQIIVEGPPLTKNERKQLSKNIRAQNRKERRKKKDLLLLQSASTIQPEGLALPKKEIIKAEKMRLRPRGDKKDARMR